MPQEEFGYNRSKNQTTGKTPFKVVYGHNPITPLDLTPIPILKQFSSEAEKHAKHVKELHSQVHNQINIQNMKYKQHVDIRRKRVIFKEGDLVWIHLRKERFPTGRFGKLQPRVNGPFRVLERINDNAYKIDLPSKYNVSGTVNVVDLSPYYVEE